MRHRNETSPESTAPGESASGNRPGGLRLSAILRELQGQAQPQPDPPNSPNGATAKSQSRRRLRMRLRRHRPPRVRSNITLGEIVDRTAHAGFGFLAAFLAMISLPFVGLSAPFGLAVSFLGGQMLVGRNRPWLPGRLRRHLVAMSTLAWLGDRVTRWTLGLERWIKPRFTMLTRGPFWAMIGLGLMIQGIGLSLPLPFPGSNWVFAVPILIYGIGLLEDDGLLVVISHATTAALVVLAVVFWELVRQGVARVFG